MAARRRRRISFVRDREEVDPVELRLARLDAAGRLDQAQQRQRDRRFARAGFANQSKAFAVTQVEADTVDGAHCPEGRMIVNAKIANLENVWPRKAVGEA